MEEITLSAPEGEPWSSTRSTPLGEESVATPITELRDRLQQHFAELVKRRDRWALTSATRRQRRDEFDNQLKILSKAIASEIARPIGDRRCRMEVRTRVYAATTDLISAVAGDCTLTARRTRSAARRRALLFGVALGTFALLATHRYLSA